VRLIFRPGLLTNEYMRGRRVRFVEPLRLYLSFSLLFFVLLKFAGPSADDALDEADDQQANVALVQQAKPAGQAAADGAATAEAAIAAMQREQHADPHERAQAARLAARQAARAAAEPAPAAPASVSEPAADGDAGREAARDDVDHWLKTKGWDKLRQKWRGMSHMSHEQQKEVLQAGFYRYAPYAIFCLMPVFALYLKVLYLGSGRRFGEHVLFALHTNAFAFLIFTLMLLIPVGIIDFFLWCWLLVYLPWAMRRVYHSGRAGTIARWAVLMFFYSISISVALAVAAGLGAATAH
jgi:hypothetical protein